MIPGGGGVKVCSADGGGKSLFSPHMLENMHVYKEEKNASFVLEMKNKFSQKEKPQPRGIQWSAPKGWRKIFLPRDCHRLHVIIRKQKHKYNVIYMCAVYNLCNLIGCVQSMLHPRVHIGMYCLLSSHHLYPISTL